MFLVALAFFAACGPEYYTCTYEVRNDWSCSQTGTKVDDWEKACKYVDDPDECETRTTGGNSCDSYGYESCCVDTSYRQVETEPDGTCFWDTDED
jgi:hypothetical protein